MSVSDEPYALQNKNERECRLKRLGDPHIAPLTEFVLSIRQAHRIRERIPYFDPCDGGAQAKALFLLESPGPKAVASGFISRNNPDPTAKNMCELLGKTGIHRSDTVLWNVVPWYVGTGAKLSGLRPVDLEKGSRYLIELLQLLPHLQCVVLVGKRAQWAKGLIPSHRVFETFHPSNRVHNRWPEKWRAIEATFQEVAALLSSSRQHSA